MEIKIQYDGKYPNLCAGKLIVFIDEVKYVFPDYCLSSGGSAYFTNGYRDEQVEKGRWSIEEWPENFPDDEQLKIKVENEINMKIPYGCCGGCL